MQEEKKEKEILFSKQFAKTFHKYMKMPPSVFYEVTLKINQPDHRLQMFDIISIKYIGEIQKGNFEVLKFILEFIKESEKNGNN